MEDWQLEELREGWKDYSKNDPVRSSITCHRFVSKSKGRRNGKQRLRKKWKEVELLKYHNGKFTSAHLFPYDTVATEVLGKDVVDSEGELIRQIQYI